MAVNQGIDSVTLGKLLKVVTSSGIRDQLSSDFKDYEFLKINRVSDPKGREMRFNLQSGFGPAAVQYVNNGLTTQFPAAQAATVSEKTAVYKETDLTVSVDFSVWKRAQKSKDELAMEPIMLEVKSKTIAAKRRLAADLYGDGLGVIGTTLTATDTTGAGGYVTIALNTTDTARGHVGFFEFGDLLLNYNPAGTIDSPTVVGTFYAWRVKDKIRETDTVILEAVDSSLAVLSLTASSIDAGDVFYRVGQTAIPDLTGAITDYGTATEVMAGLESLGAKDGRAIWGITMSGATAGSQYDVGDVQIDFSHIQSVLSSAKTKVGAAAYAWKNLNMAHEAYDALLMAHQTDLRLAPADSSRGLKGVQFRHGQDLVEFVQSEYCPKKRMWSTPEARQGQGKVVEFYGTDFEVASVNGSDAFSFAPGSSGRHNRTIVHYMNALQTLVCKHPAAVVSLRNFNIA